MTRHDYFLQYCLYCVALHRYLTLRVPNYDYEQHFGGVYYLFLRGMRPEWGAQFGVFRDRIEQALVYAEQKGWRIEVGGGHTWGKMYCPFNDKECRCGEFCIACIWCTPKSPANHAKHIRRVVDNCTANTIE